MLPEPKIANLLLRTAHTADAYKQLGVPPDPREYEQAGYILSYFRFSSVRLMTNNPGKIKGLTDLGFEVERVALESQPTDQNRGYLRAKALKLGHLMREFGTEPS
jgi:GTP cyclohydrolase II